MSPVVQSSQIEQEQIVLSSEVAASSNGSCVIIDALPTSDTFTQPVAPLSAAQNPTRAEIHDRVQ